MKTLASIFAAATLWLSGCVVDVDVSRFHHFHFPPSPKITYADPWAAIIK